MEVVDTSHSGLFIASLLRYLLRAYHDNQRNSLEKEIFLALEFLGHTHDLIEQN